MKNFIFAMCGFLMMSLVSLDVQASGVSERITCKSELAAVDVGLPDIQFVSSVSTPIDFLTIHPAPAAPDFVVPNGSVAQPSCGTAMPGKRIEVRCPFRYVYKARYCTHYSFVVTKLITPC